MCVQQPICRFDLQNFLFYLTSIMFLSLQNSWLRRAQLDSFEGKTLDILLCTVSALWCGYFSIDNSVSSVLFFRDGLVAVCLVMCKVWRRNITQK